MTCYWLKKINGNTVTPIYVKAGSNAFIGVYNGDKALPQKFLAKPNYSFELFLFWYALLSKDLNLCFMENKKCILLFFKLKKKCHKQTKFHTNKKGGIFPLFFQT